MRTKFLFITGIILLFGSTVFCQRSDIEDYCSMSVNYGRINDSPHSGNLSPEAVYWYYITITDDTYDVVFSACNSDFKPELEIWHGCGESERNFLYGNDNTGDCKITVDYLPAGTYYVRIYRNKSDLGYGNYSFEISLE